MALDHLAQDLRYSWRRLWRSPGFLFTAVVTLALGIGANTALFSVINGVLFKSLSYISEERMVAIARIERGTGRVFLSIDEDSLRALSGLPDSPIDQLVVHDPLIGAITVSGRAERFSGELVSGNYFGALGVAPLAGRLLQPSDDVPGGTETPAVISERMWRRVFHADPDVIGRVGKIADHPVVIVGVVPALFKGTWLPMILATDLWLPVRVQNQVRTVQGEGVVTSHVTLATLRQGASARQAQAVVETIGQHLPGTAGASDLDLTVLPARASVVMPEFDHYGSLLASAVLGLSALVLLIACANLTNLLLARGAARAGEIATRTSLGASRWRVFQLLVSEAAFVAALAGGAALAVAVAITWLLNRWQLPAVDGIVMRFDVSPDYRVFAYAVVASFVTAVVVGVVPARLTLRRTSWNVLASSAVLSTTSPGRRARSRLVALQMALSMVLLVAAGLYVRSAIAAMRFDPGYDVGRGAMASVDLRMHKIEEPRGRRLFARLLEAAMTAPGVQYAALTTAIPATRSTSSAYLVPAELAGLRTGGVFAFGSSVSPGFFTTLGITLLDGRDFSAIDTAASSKVAIVGARAAARLWPNASPIGRRLQLGSQGDTVEVVGVVTDTATGLTRTSVATYYVPASQHYSPRMHVVVRGSGPPTAMLEPLGQALRNVDTDVAVFDERTVAEAVGLLLTPIRVAAIILGALGLLGLGIAALGVYGVMAYFVSQRSREFGLHKALGATARDIHRIVLRQGSRMLLWGVLPGLVAAAIGAGFLRALLYGIDAHDPVTFTVVPALLVVVGLAACYFPARRAARVDANVALRQL